MPAGYNTTNLVVSRSYLQDATGMPPAIAPSVAGSDESIFVNTPYARGLVPFISETEWLAAWSAMVEFWVLFRIKFFTLTPVFPELDWVIPTDFSVSDRSPEARLRVPSVRQLSQFMLHPDAFLGSPDPAGLWVRRMELATEGAIGVRALVPFSEVLVTKYNFPGDELLRLPEACEELFDPTQGVFGSFGTEPSHLVGLFPYDPSNTAGIVPSKTRTRFIPALGSAGVRSLLDLGLTATLGELLDSHWLPSGVPVSSGSLDFVVTDDSILRMAFGGTPPDDAGYVNLLRTGVLDNPGLGATISAPFRSSPISLLLFLKSIVNYVAAGSSCAYLKPGISVRLPVVSYRDTGTRIKVSHTGGGAYSWTSSPCGGPTTSGGDTIAGRYGNDVSDTTTGHVYTNLPSAFAGVTGGRVTGTDARVGAASYETDLWVRTLTTVGTHTSDGWFKDYVQCLGELIQRYESASSESSAINDLTEQSVATATLPAPAWPESLTPWSSTIFDLLKDAVGEDELSFLDANGFIKAVSVYASVWVGSVSCGPAAVSATATDLTSKVPGGEYVHTTTISHTGTATTPAAAATAFIDPLVAAVALGTRTGLSDIVATCTGSSLSFPVAGESDPGVTDNSISVSGPGPFLHETILLWTGDDLAHELTESSAYAAIMAAAPVSTALAALAAFSPARTTASTVRDIADSGYTDSRGPDYVYGAYSLTSSDSTEDYESDDVQDRLRGSLDIRVGELFVKIEYNFTHYRNSPPS